jgi:hypothetical protein
MNVRRMSGKAGTAGAALKIAGGGNHGLSTAFR